MREILFRGKRVDNDEWCCGSLVNANFSWHKYGKHREWIVVSAFANGGFFNVAGRHAVKPDTVGQYTGMTDKNGKRIFEGDIVSDVYDRSVNYKVCYDLAGFYLKHSPPEEHGFSYTMIPLCNYQHAFGATIEIVGNIYDNPELIGD